MVAMQMIDVPADGEGLSWIVDQGATQLLLIPRLQPASIVAAAAGDQQALAYYASQLSSTQQIPAPALSLPSTEPASRPHELHLATTTIDFAQSCQRSIRMLPLFLKPARDTQVSSSSKLQAQASWLL